jgi:hypothetical protein
VLAYLLLQDRSDVGVGGVSSQGENGPGDGGGGQSTTATRAALVNDYKKGDCGGAQILTDLTMLVSFISVSTGRSSCQVRQPRPVLARLILTVSAAEVGNQ